MHSYIQAILCHAQFEADSDGSTFGSVEALPGIVVHATGHNYNACKSALHRLVQASVAHALRTGVALPTVDGILPPQLVSAEHEVGVL